MNQPCGHPLAARQISVVPAGRDKGKIVTTCWACEVEREIRAR